MPLPMVHLGVARNLIDIFSINDLPSFYLGSIAPDAVHMRDNFCQDDKSISHMRNEDKKLWENDIVSYIKTKVNSDVFLTGYSVHILTDIIWNRTLYTSFKTKYNQDDSPMQEQRWAYYNDTDKLDFELFYKMSYTNEMMEMLSKSKPVDVIGLVSSDEIAAWNERTLHWYDGKESQHKNPIKYITFDELINFMQSAAIEISNLIYGN
ncbi:MAG: zinc dependent phospholipase C family protein [Eubacteriales bacterium]|nr:zinc dependent phospholipase C family protein [Eubacteriales bacterium]MDD4476198.1 zinc dependent phospholipase C family protein [Eubacteriales bacterium]